MDGGSNRGLMPPALKAKCKQSAKKLGSDACIQSSFRFSETCGQFLTNANKTHVLCHWEE